MRCSSLAHLAPLVAVIAALTFAHKTYDGPSASSSVLPIPFLSLLLPVVAAFPLGFLLKALVDLSRWGLPGGLRLVGGGLSVVCSLFVVSKLCGVLLLLTSVWWGCESVDCCSVLSADCKSSEVDSLSVIWRRHVESGLGLSQLCVVSLVWLCSWCAVCAGGVAVRRATMCLLVCVCWSWAACVCALCVGTAGWGSVLGVGKVTAQGSGFVLLLHVLQVVSGPVLSQPGLSSLSGWHLGVGTAVGVCVLLLHDTLYSLAASVVSAGGETCVAGFVGLPVRALALQPSPVVWASVWLVGALCVLTGAQLSLCECVLGRVQAGRRCWAAAALCAGGWAASLVCLSLQRRRVTDMLLYNGVAGFAPFFCLLGVAVCVYEAGLHRLLGVVSKRRAVWLHHAWRHVALACLLLAITSRSAHALAGSLVSIHASTHGERAAGVGLAALPILAAAAVGIRKMRSCGTAENKEE